MLSLLFDCSAFEISTTVQAVNDVLFPVVLFVIIFWLMCEIFITDIAVDDNFTTVETQPNVNNPLKVIKTDNYKTEMELPNVEIKRQHLKISR